MSLPLLSIRAADLSSPPEGGGPQVDPDAPTEEAAQKANVVEETRATMEKHVEAVDQWLNETLDTTVTANEVKKVKEAAAVAAKAALRTVSSMLSDMWLAGALQDAANAVERVATEAVRAQKDLSKDPVNDVDDYERAAVAMAKVQAAAAAEAAAAAGVPHKAGQELSPSEERNTETEWTAAAMVYAAVRVVAAKVAAAKVAAAADVEAMVSCVDVVAVQAVQAAVETVKMELMTEQAVKKVKEAAAVAAKAAPDLYDAVGIRYRAVKATTKAGEEAKVKAPAAVLFWKKVGSGVSGGDEGGCGSGYGGEGGA